MEQLKLALLGVIAATLVVRTAGDLIPTAHAQTNPRVTCEIFWIGTPTPRRLTPESLADQLALFEPVRSWLEAHPGEVVYRTDDPIGELMVCVRG
jgi:hypothetical protein